MMSSEKSPGHNKYSTHKKALSKFRAAPVAPLTQATRLFHTERVDEAQQLVKEILQSDPQNKEAGRLMSMISAYYSGYKLVREEIAVEANNKTIGGGIRRYHFMKKL